MMTAPAQTLELVSVDIAPIARPTHNLIVADAAFLSTLKAVEATVAALKITDAISLQAAADMQARLTTAGKTLENTRVQLKAPFLALNKQIDAAAQPVQLRIDLAKRALSIAQTNYVAEQRRLAEEAERARQAELRRLEAIRVAEEAAAKKESRRDRGTGAETERSCGQAGGRGTPCGVAGCRDSRGGKLGRN